jgi:hypothetical protein
VSDFRFLHTLPTGKGKKADIYQKRRFAFGFVFYRFCAAFVSKYFVYYQCYPRYRDDPLYVVANTII